MNLLNDFFLLAEEGGGCCCRRRSTEKVERSDTIVWPDEVSGAILLEPCDLFGDGAGGRGRGDRRRLTRRVAGCVLLFVCLFFYLCVSFFFVVLFRPRRHCGRMRIGCENRNDHVRFPFSLRDPRVSGSRRLILGFPILIACAIVHYNQIFRNPPPPKKKKSVVASKFVIFAFRRFFGYSSKQQQESGRALVHWQFYWSSLGRIRAPSTTAFWKGAPAASWCAPCSDIVALDCFTTICSLGLGFCLLHWSCFIFLLFFVCFVPLFFVCFFLCLLFLTLFPRSPRFVLFVCLFFFSFAIARFPPWSSFAANFTVAPQRLVALNGRLTSWCCSWCSCCCWCWCYFSNATSFVSPSSVRLFIVSTITATATARRNVGTFEFSPLAEPRYRPLADVDVDADADADLDVDAVVAMGQGLLSCWLLARPRSVVGGNVFFSFVLYPCCPWGRARPNGRGSGPSFICARLVSWRRVERETILVVRPPRTTKDPATWRNNSNIDDDDDDHGEPPNATKAKPKIKIEIKNKNKKNEAKQKKTVSRPVEIDAPSTSTFASGGQTAWLIATRK